jgi:hypothetical protein
MHRPSAICCFRPAIGDFGLCSGPLRFRRAGPQPIRHFSFVTRHGALSLLALLLCWPALAQRAVDQRPSPLDPAQAKVEARVLVAELLAQKPDQNSTNSGQVRIRDREGKEIEIPARFEIISTPTNWLSIYEILPSAGRATGERLVVIHTDGQPNQYRLGEQTLAPGQTLVPFAGSDFWIADLGLQFLHWPEQRLLKREMRRSKACCVLESVNPQPSPSGYSRVVAWITAEAPHGIVHADAYDSRNQLLKLFDPVNLEKVNGDYQLAEIEMRNRQSGSHTWIKFDLTR